MTTLDKIETEADYDQSMTHFLTLMDTDLLPDSAEALAFEQLAASIADYEKEHTAPIQVSALEALRFRMEQQPLTPEDLLPVLSSAQQVAAILQGQQNLSHSEMTKLQQRFGIPFAEPTPAPPTEPTNEAN